MSPVQVRTPWPRTLHAPCSVTLLITNGIAGISGCLAAWGAASSLLPRQLPPGDSGENISSSDECKAVPRVPPGPPLSDHCL